MKTWQEASEIVRELEQRLFKQGGTPLDIKIKPLIIALQALDLPTEGSCWGHDRDHRITFPEVSFLIPPPAEPLNEGNKEEHKLFREALLAAQQKLTTFLDRFYFRRHTPFEARLHTGAHKNNSWGVFYLESFGAEIGIEQCLSTAEKRRKLPLYQAEMDAFTNFLRALIAYNSQPRTKRKSTESCPAIESSRSTRIDRPLSPRASCTSAHHKHRKNRKR